MPAASLAVSRRSETLLGEWHQGNGGFLFKRQGRIKEPTTLRDLKNNLFEFLLHTHFFVWNWNSPA
jgi:hypothetical protein